MKYKIGIILGGPKEDFVRRLEKGVELWLKGKINWDFDFGDWI